MRPACSRADAASSFSYAAGRDSASRVDASRGHGQRVPGQRAGLVDGPVGRDVSMISRAAAVGAHRQPAADDLAQAGEVGLAAEDGLRAAEREPEAGHHLVEDQQRARLAA